MPTTEVNLAERSGSLVESHKSYDPRILFFYAVLGAMVLTLIAGLAYQQLSKAGDYQESERVQNQRRIIIPGPRGNIYDRNHRLIVGNRARFSVRLLLDELRPELRREHIRIRNNYRAMDDDHVPSRSQLEQIARVSVVQRYLDQVNAIVGRNEKVDARDLQRHFNRELLLPYALIDDLTPEEYARLIERLPVNSPAQVYTFSTRDYPYGSAASHTLGYVGSTDDIEIEDFPGEDLKTFKMKGTMGRDGIEKQFDDILQGEAGGAIFRVDPSGNRINPPIEQVLPKQGQDVILSLDIDLQLVAEEKLAEFELAGAAVALDVNTGEVLVLADKPDYNLNDFSPRLSSATAADIEARGAWFKRAVQGTYPPGSTFKILTAIAGLRAGALTPDRPIVNCDGWIRVGNRRFPCYNGQGHHHDVLLPEAISESCDIYFYRAGELMTPEVLAAEARRFHLDRRTGIELPDETGRMIVPDPAWMERARGEKWFPGDTANVSIGQGDLLLTPLQMACFTASVARGQVFTKPTILHDPNRPPQRHEAIGLTTAERAALLKGMVDVTIDGTARILTSIPALRVPGVRIAGKTGTAQKRVMKDGKLGTINFAWFICFAPAENPEIALAVILEGETLGQEFGGGRNSAPVASAILQKYFASKGTAPRRSE